MTSKKKILDDIMNRKTYVAFTPYFTSSMGNRRQLNMITLPRYSKSEIVNMLDTEGAVNYMEEATQAIEDFTISVGKTPIWGNISCEVSYFIDARLFDDKNFRPSGPQEGDIIRGINCVTVGYSSMKDGSEFISRRTFVVNLDEFVSFLEKLGYVPAFSPKRISDRVVDTVLLEGLSSSLELNFTKNYKLKAYSMSI